MKNILKALVLVLIMTSQAWSADEWNKGLPQASDLKSAWPAASQAQNGVLDRLLANYQQGMFLTYTSATTITAGAGSITCSNTAGTVRHMRQNLTATSITFSNIDTGSSAANTTYYVYADCDANATTATFVISASGTSPTGVTYYAQIGSFSTDSASSMTNIINNSILNYNGTNVSKSINVPYQALTDLFAGCYANPHANSTNVTIEEGTISASMTAIQVCGFGNSSVNMECSVAWPITKGDYYEFVSNATGENCFVKATSK